MEIEAIGMDISTYIESVHVVLHFAVRIHSDRLSSKRMVQVICDLVVDGDYLCQFVHGTYLSYLDADVDHERSHPDQKEVDRKY